jgi:hypothetical protein
MGQKCCACMQPLPEEWEIETFSTPDVVENEYQDMDRQEESQSQEINGDMYGAALALALAR